MEPGGSSMTPTSFSRTEARSSSSVRIDKPQREHRNNKKPEQEELEGIPGPLGHNKVLHDGALPFMAITVASVTNDPANPSRMTFFRNPARYIPPAMIPARIR